jgi:DNA-binding MarR family transcriptional regulator
MTAAHKNPLAGDDPLELNDFLCFAMYSASHAFNRVYQPLLRDLGLTYPQFIALILLWAEDGQTVGELGEKLFLQSNTLTPMLKRLETLGYVARARDAADERQVRISLTDAGRSLRGRAATVVARVRAATGVDDDQMGRMLSDVGALRGSLARHAQPED